MTDEPRVVDSVFDGGAPCSEHKFYLPPGEENHLVFTIVARKDYRSHDNPYFIESESFEELDAQGIVVDFVGMRERQLAVDKPVWEFDAYEYLIYTRGYLFDSDRSPINPVSDTYNNFRKNYTIVNHKNLKLWMSQTGSFPARGFIEKFLGPDRQSMRGLFNIGFLSEAEMKASLGGELILKIVGWSDSPKGSRDFFLPLFPGKVRVDLILLDFEVTVCTPERLPNVYRGGNRYRFTIKSEEGRRGGFVNLVLFFIESGKEEVVVVSGPYQNEDCDEVHYLK